MFTHENYRAIAAILAQNSPSKDRTTLMDETKRMTVDDIAYDLAQYFSEEENRGHGFPFHKEEFMTAACEE